jgi:hypothetical protein
MRRSEPDRGEWYGPWWRWLIVVWVVWWGALYSKMVVQQRGWKVEAAIRRLGCPPLTAVPGQGRIAVESGSIARSRSHSVPGR